MSIDELVEKSASTKEVVPFETIWTDLIGFSMALGIEMSRAELVHPDLSPLSKGNPPPVNYENAPDLLVNSLQHGGNILEGFGISYFTYYGLHKISMGKIPEKVKLALSLLASNLTVVGVEAGGLGSGGPDVLDIPAGVVGSSLFLGVHLLSKCIVDRKRGLKKFESDSVG